jgi:hypothetical protein
MLKYFYLNTRNLNSNPTKIDEIVKVFETMDSDIHKHKDNKVYGLKVTGVPIRFALIPIKHFIDLENIIDKRYIKLKRQTTDKFSKILNHIRDFNIPNCIRNRVFDTYSDSGTIIFNLKSKICEEIRVYENTLIEITNNYLCESGELLKNYKNKKVEEDKISEFVLKFENEFKITQVDLKIQEFVDKCKTELDGIKFKDSLINKTDDKSKIKDGYQLFTDEDACKEWLNTDRFNKILLKTDGKKSSECNY